jgi:hypothetical protein
VTSVYRVTALWDGFHGAPGYSKFSFADLTDATSRNAAGAKVRELFQTLRVGMASSWTVQVQPTVEEFDMATGALIGAAAMTTPPAVVTGTLTGSNYAGGSGYCITWNTGLIIGRRRVRGRTFFVPAINVFDTDGTINSGSHTLISGAAATFTALTAPRPHIWSRQWSGTTPPVQVGGALAPVDSYTLKDMASQLRSRRL